MQYIIGLGNPDVSYEDTRHNIGRTFVQSYALLNGFPEWNIDKHAQARVAEKTVGTVPVTAVLPETFMNRSGETVSYICTKQGATARDLVVVFDDVNLPLGTVRVSVNRGDGGHNGVSSIISALKNKGFVQVRIGIAPVSFWTGTMKRPDGANLGTFVLGKFTRSERAKLEALQSNVFGAIETIVRDGVERAMNEYN